MRIASVVTALCLVLSLLLGGGAGFGRVLIALGLPGFASSLFSDPTWRGVALYRAGKMQEAAEAFHAAGNFYNLGNAQVQLGNYAAALEAYDVAIAGGDADARANFDSVAAFYAGLAIDPDAMIAVPQRDEGPEAESSIARGAARASGTGSEVTNDAGMLGLLELESRGRLGVRRVFDDKFMLADQRWLEQLADVPGEYLSARISHEHKRRAKLGLIPPDPEDPR